MAARTRVEDTLALSMRCACCGRPVVLVADHGSVELPDREAFLSTHRRCMNRRGGSHAEPTAGS